MTSYIKRIIKKVIKQGTTEFWQKFGHLSHIFRLQIFLNKFLYNVRLKHGQYVFLRFPSFFFSFCLFLFKKISEDLFAVEEIAQWLVTLLRFGFSYEKMRDARAIFGAFVFIGKQPLPPLLAHAAKGCTYFSYSHFH